MLAALGLWSEIAERAQPILDMVITDSRLGDPVRPVFLTFGGEVEPGEPFAHMVESGALVAALTAASRARGVRLRPIGVRGFDAADESIAVTLADGEVVEAALLVAADGGRSRLRDEAGIGWVGWSYPQSGIVATVAHERDHEGRAVEHFLPSGPFATLPLPPGGPLGHRSSIVWTEASESVPHLLALDPDGCARRGRAPLRAPARPHHARDAPAGVPLVLRHRPALRGRAAGPPRRRGACHPSDRRPGPQSRPEGCRGPGRGDRRCGPARPRPGRSRRARRYERARRFDTVAMGVVTDGLNRLFSNDVLPVRLARDLGLGLVDRMPALKRFFIREAAGLAGAGPRLLRGEPL